MQLTERHIVNKNSELFTECEQVCFYSKNLYNYANYLVRQTFISTSKDKEAGLVDHATYLNYNEINKILIKDNQPDYIKLPRKISNQTLMLLDRNWASFFRSIKDYVKHPEKYKGKPSLPKYLDKQGRFIATYELGAISKKELKHGVVRLSGTNIRVTTTRAVSICQCRIVPKNGYYVIEIIYNQQEEQLKEGNGRYASIDMGLGNLATIGSNVMKPFIVNGKPIKSVNQYYNKKKAKLQSHLDGEKKTSKRIQKLTNKRTNKIDDYLHKASRYIINHLVSNEINTLVVGNNKAWKQEINIGSRNNQNFVSIPHSRFICMLSYKCKLAGIEFILNEEAYTSKCSFIDNEEICKHEDYCGKRIKRGLFRSKEGILINADLNGALNILRKAVPNVFTDGIEAISVSPRVVTL